MRVLSTIRYKMQGFIHSVESFGTVDGPGIRLVVFTQGCPMRCAYCHNPDTWDIKGGKEISVEEILAQYNKNKAFYKNGGITVSGGEPLVQMEFVTEIFKKAKENNIHTCLDTSGVTFKEGNTEYLSKLDNILQYCDLVMLDIKHINSDEHKKLTGFGNENILAFAEYLDSKNIPLWIRHVVIENITYKKQYLYELGLFLGTLHNIKALDVLPYHTMGEGKYEELGIEYKLKGIKPLSKDKAQIAKQIIIEGIRKERLSNK